MGWVQMIFVFLRALLRSQADLAVEKLALQQQLAVLLQQHSKRPRLRRRDRILWVWLSRIWTGWCSCLIIVQPDTVIRWLSQGFKLYWRRKSRRGKVGRPSIEAETRKLIRRMSRKNPTWGTPRIRSELRLLGYDVSKATVDKYRVRHRKPPSQTWKTFLDNHARDIVAIDFLTVPTATFRVLFAFVAGACPRQLSTRRVRFRLDGVFGNHTPRGHTRNARRLRARQPFKPNKAEACTKFRVVGADSTEIDYSPRRRRPPTRWTSAD